MENLIKIAAEVLQTTEEEAAKNSKPVPEIEGAYFWKPGRGGISVIINGDGEKLAATSAVGFNEHLQAFMAGRRN